MYVHLVDGERPLYNLSAAIERGDLKEARHWLDYIAHCKDEWRQEIDNGRFSLSAKGVV